MTKNASKTTAVKKPAAKKAATPVTADRTDDQLGKATVAADAGSAPGNGDGGSKTVSKGATAAAANPNPEPAAHGSGNASEASVTAPAADTPPASSPAGTLQQDGAAEARLAHNQEVAGSNPAPATNSTDTPPERKTDGGAGHNPAGPAGGDLDLDKLLAAGPNGLAALGTQGLDQLGKNLDAMETDFRKRFPKWCAAVDAWAALSEEAPSGLRIASKHEGFRRAGMSHSKQPREHAIETFTRPEQLEALFAEPNLTVELI